MGGRLPSGHGGNTAPGRRGACLVRTTVDVVKQNYTPLKSSWGVQRWTCHGATLGWLLVWLAHVSRLASRVSHLTCCLLPVACALTTFVAPVCFVFAPPAWQYDLRGFGAALTCARRSRYARSVRQAWHGAGAAGMCMSALNAIHNHIHVTVAYAQGGAAVGERTHLLLRRGRCPVVRHRSPALPRCKSPKQKLLHTCTCPSKPRVHADRPPCSLGVRATAPLPSTSVCKIPQHTPDP